MEKESFSPAAMNSNATDLLQAFQEFWALAKFWLKDQYVNRSDQQETIVYLLGHTGIEVWNSFTWDDPTDKGSPAKS